MVSSVAFRLLLMLHGAGGAAKPVSLAPVPLASGTPMWLKSERTVPLQVGQPVQAKLQYGVYAGDRLVLSPGTVVEGRITGLQADRPHRRESRLRADFTPFCKPVVQFGDAIVNGVKVPLQVTAAVDGAPVMHLTPPPPRKGGFVRGQIDQGIGMAKDRLGNVTRPGKRDRLVGLLYSQLPYHPQRVVAGTEWTVDTTASLALLPIPIEVKPAAPAPIVPAPTLTALDTPAPATWTVQACLQESLTSASNEVGDPIRAVVTEPVMNPDGTVAVPVGTVLQGAVTQAKPARRYGRDGALRLDFTQVLMPGDSKAQEVQATVTGVDAQNADLTMDREGQVKPKPKDKVVVPLLLFALAASPLDRDGHAEGSVGKNAGASNSLGSLGFIVGTAAGSASFASGIGFYGTALAVWNRWLKRGDETTWRHDTRIVVQVTPRRSSPLRAEQISQAEAR